MPLPEIPLFKVLMSPDAPARVAKVLASGQIAQGPEVDAFEVELGHFLGVDPVRVITVNSGTSALDLAYHLAGIGHDDIAIVSPMTCSATVSPLVHRRAQIVWADVDPITGNIDPASVGELIDEWGDRVKAVVAVDWGGRPAPYAEMRKVVPHRIPIIEDAAHAFLAMRPGVVPTSRMQIGMYAETDHIYLAYSTQAIKHLTTGDGGILICPSKAAADRARLLRWFGLDRRGAKDFRCAQEITEAGWKFHMNDIAASIGLANLPGAIEAVSRHRAHAAIYNGGIDRADHGRLVRPPWDPGSSWWLYTLLVDDRESFQTWMKDHGIHTSQVHRRNDEHPAFPSSAPDSLPGLDAFSARQVSVPCGWWLSDDDLDRVMNAINGWATR